MVKLNPRDYVNKHLENVKANERRLKAANEIMEKKKQNPPRGGRKTKKEREGEARMMDQAAFLLFLEKENQKKSEE